MNKEVIEKIAVEIYPDHIVQLSPTLFHNTADIRRHDFIQGYNLHDEEFIELIQFLSMNEEFNGYSSVTKETAKHFLEQFKKTTP